MFADLIKKFLDFQTDNDNRILLEANFRNFNNPTLGSCEVPHKIGAV